MGKVVAEGARIEVRELAEDQRKSVRPRSSRTQRRISIALLLISDILMFTAGVFAARWASHVAFHLPNGEFFGSSWSAIQITAAAYLVIYWAYGLYSSSLLSSGGSDYRAVGNANAIGLVAAILIAGYQTSWALDARTIV